MSRPAADTTGEPPAGQPPAFERVFEQELTYMVHSLRRLGVRESDLEDVAHDTFLTVRRLLPAYDPSRPLRPWLFAIALRAASDYRRRAVVRREVATDEFGTLADTAPPADEQLAARQARELVLAALDTLELDQRTVLVMHDIDERAVPEIAAALGIPLNTAYTRLRLARERVTAAVRRLRRQRGER